MEQRTLELTPQHLTEDALGFFRWGPVAGKVVVTNDAGEWAVLSDAELADLLAGRIGQGHPRFSELQAKGCLRDGLDLDALAARIAQRNAHIRRGPHLHVVTVTRLGVRADANGQSTPALDMNRETAERIVDFALQTTSPAVTLELQGDGGEPLANADVLRHLVETARARNKRAAGKALTVRVLTNCSAMTEEHAEWLLANDVQVTTSLDGPADVHDQNRRWKAGSAHAEVTRWIEYFTRRYAELGRDPEQWHVSAVATVTRHTLDAAQPLVDEYVARGLRVLHLLPIERWAFDADTWAAVGYDAAEYLAFYQRVLDAIVAVNRRGVPLADRLAAVIAKKIVSNDDPGVVDVQSPTGAGTGQVAYDVDGRIFPCDDARWLGIHGEPMFELGQVGDVAITDLARHPTVRAIAAASLLDAQPLCADAWTKPYCGVSPVRTFLAEGDLFGQRARCFQWQQQQVAATTIMSMLADERDAESAEIAKRWPIISPRAAGDGRVLLQAP